MNGSPFTQSPRMATLVRKYQTPRESCLGRKTRLYYWLEAIARRY